MHFGVVIVCVNPFFLCSLMEKNCNKKITNSNLELGRIFGFRGFLFSCLYFVLITNLS